MPDAQSPDAKQKRAAHMKRRRGHGLKLKEVGDEFGVSRQHAGRIVSLASSADMARGYTHPTKGDCK